MLTALGTGILVLSGVPDGSQSQILGCPRAWDDLLPGKGFSAHLSQSVIDSCAEAEAFRALLRFDVS